MPTEQGRPVGATVISLDVVHFRVWAPRRQQVEVVIEDGANNASFPLKKDAEGFFSADVKAGPGSRYRYRLDAGNNLFPDPTSRFQPEGPHGPSEVVDPSAFHWSDVKWPGAGLEGQVVYELHIGTFTPQGTWQAATEQLEELAGIGITVIEVMPVADFPGRFGWGYDGVCLYAPTRIYGSPDDFRRFVDKAHEVGIGVILDVVYNHIGPDGNYLNEFSKDYFTDRYKNEWGEAINFDGLNSGPVREFFIGNAGYWIEEYHLDGLRLDATQQIFDASKDNVMTALGRRVREKARGRKTIIVAENETQETRLVRSEQRGGYGLDALWNDDFHHSALVAMTGKNPAYYTDYYGTPQEFISAIKWGYLYQGQRYKWQKKRRGTPALDLPPAAFVTFLENHDQIANSARGERVHQLTSTGRFKTLTALLLLAPGTPMLFQGQEFAATAPFLFFADHNPELAKLVAKGRREFLGQFPSLAQTENQTILRDPSEMSTFTMCKLDFAERQKHQPIYQLHKDLLELRKSDPAFRAQKQRGLDGAVLGSSAFVLRFFVDGGMDRLLVLNLGRDLHLDPAPEPLLAPPAGAEWSMAWSSEEVRYGGCGIPPMDAEENWRIPGESATVLIPKTK